MGIGILTTAQKKGLLKPEHADIAPELMCQLNNIGRKLSDIEGVKAMTDVTGFGLIGHLSEMCEGSNLSAIIEFEKIPRIDVLDEYIEQKCMPGGTGRNWTSYGKHVELADENYKSVLCDPQTSGGLLIAVEKSSAPVVEKLLQDEKIEVHCLGKLVEKQEKLIKVL